MHHTQDKTGKSKPPKLLPHKPRGRGTLTAAPLGKKPKHEERRNTGAEGRLGSITAGHSLGLGGQGIEFKRSFRKLSAKLISERSPATSTNSENVSTGMNSSWNVFRALSAAS